MKRWKTGLVALVLAGGALALGGCAAGNTGVPDKIQVESADSKVISVTAREQVKVEPDTAQVIYSVYSQASDAQTCQTQNNTDLEKVLALLKQEGVNDTSVQTSSYGLDPIYDWENGKTISGYEMTTRVTVSDIPLADVGELLSQSVDAGINSIDSVTYLSSQYDEAYQEALAAAVESARIKAQAMAEAGGCKLGALVKLDEYADSQEARYNTRFSAAKEEAAMDMAAGAMAVMPGQLEIEAFITAEFAIE